jgi:hypothetical protein
MKNIVQIATLIILTTITAFGADVNTAAQNVADANKTIQTEKHQKSDETAKIQQENEQLKTENAVMENAVKAYEKSMNHLKWGLWGMVVLVIVSVGILVFESTREYKEALRDTKEAAKEAKETAKEVEKAAEKARDWEAKAQKTFNEIDTTVKKKLDEIEEKTEKIIETKANEAIEQIGKKAEAEREKSRKEAEKEKQTSERWARSLQEVLTGNTILEQAQKREGAEAARLFAEGYAKYKEAIKIEPGMYEAWNNWGSVLLEQAKKKEGDRKKRLVQEAKEKFLKAAQIRKGISIYNLVCVAAIEDNKEECRKWLKTGEEVAALPTKKYAMKDDDLKIYREKDWFKAIKWKGEK